MFKDLKTSHHIFPNMKSSEKSDYPHGGQLALKMEAAGKVRVFALVDI
jgi:hypothetical protein